LRFNARGNGEYECKKDIHPGLFHDVCFLKEGLRGVRRWPSDSRKHHSLSITFFLEYSALISSFFLEDHWLISNFISGTHSFNSRIFLDDLTLVSSFLKVVKRASNVSTFSFWSGFFPGLSVRWFAPVVADASPVTPRH
jgi:hypothetical protein